MLPKYIVEQKITAFTNKYQVFSANEQGKKGSVVAFAQQKRIALKEKITFFSDSTKKTEIFGFQAEKVIDVHGKYEVKDPSGKVIGVFKKEFAKSLLNSTWAILDQDGNTIMTVRESNKNLAILRRFAGFIPLIGDLIELVLPFFRYHFEFVDTKSGMIVGQYKKTKLFRDHYLLSLDESKTEQVDWRLFASIAVALDALQSR